MTRKKTLKDFSADDLQHELVARFAVAPAVAGSRALFREHGFPTGSGAADSAMRNARKLAGLRAAYRTARPLDFDEAIQRGPARDKTAPAQVADGSPHRAPDAGRVARTRQVS